MDRVERSSEPLHAQIAARVRREVHDGTYAPGQRLPAEVQLAQQLGVSRGTVRQALTALLDEGLLQTVPGRGTFVSDGSAQRSVGLIGLIMPSVVRARNPELVDGAAEIARQVGYSLILGISGDERWLEAEQLQRIAAQGASGALVYSVDGPTDMPVVRHMVERGFPLVLIDRYVPDLAVDTVTLDNLGGGFLATQHLIERGYRRVGYLGTDNTGTSTMVERMAGYRWALQQYGLPYQADLVCAAMQPSQTWPLREPEKQRHNDRVVRDYLCRADRPDAVFVSDDYTAFQVVELAEELGIRIPEDVGLVGFDNVSHTDYFGVPLTTVEQHRHDMGATAMSLLLDRIAGRRAQVGRVVIATGLVVRRSSGAAWSKSEPDRGEATPWQRAASVS